MNRILFFIMALSLSAVAFAQDDDMYFIPKKQSTVKQATQTYYVGSDRDVDEYNRHGNLYSSVTEIDNDDIIDFDAELGVYPDSVETDSLYEYPYFDPEYEVDDFIYSRELDRWYDGDEVLLDDPEEWGPYRGYFGFYSPYYYDYYWWGGWYSPWYYSWWGGWYHPWYYSGWWGGWHGGGHHLWLADGRHGRGHSNRGRARYSGGGGVRSLTGNGSRRIGSNAYNNIAKRSRQTGTRYSGGGGVSSNRTTGSRYSTSNSSTSRSYNYGSSQTRSTSSFSGGSRSGGFGGSRSGGFGGGGSHGGRR